MLDAFSYQQVELSCISVKIEKETGLAERTAAEGPMRRAIRSLILGGFICR